MSEPLTAYCVKCRAKRPIENPEAVFTSRGGPATRGVCTACGTALFRTGRTEAHQTVARPQPEPAARRGKLVIVESPTKARTIGRFLGKDFRVVASLGHVRDLLRSRLSVDVDNDFEPAYRVPNDKRKLVKELTAAVQKADTVYLATDPDREGEAIAWHLLQATGLDPDRACRVVFHEITQTAIAAAFAQPAGLDMNLIGAQQARRILDRLVGYQISPLLWERVRSRLTAGRVQSVAVRLVVEREREIEAFAPAEYWTLAAELIQRKSPPSPQADSAPPGQQEASRRSFVAKLHQIRGRSFELISRDDVTPILDALESGVFRASRLKTGRRQRRPQPPFTTSTLQQTASTRLRYRAARTMRVAQQLYEGIDLGEAETVGLITYMRTDSVEVAQEAQREAREWVTGHYGQEYLPPTPPRYKTRTQRAQEAHEAIRPTSVFRAPAAVKTHLTRDQLALYQLIWQRFLASQMAPAVYATQSADILAGPAAGETPYLFRASGSSLTFAGYLVAFPDVDDQADQLLPSLTEGEPLDLVRLLPQQHFTEPPPRYTEATLIGTLEEHGIGRPSTYAPIVSTVQQRGYVQNADQSGRTLGPTEVGILVDNLLSEHFPEVISVGFTADMEARLDRVAAGETDWVSVVREFYGPFSARLVEAEKNLPDMNLGDEPVGRECPDCQNPLVIKHGRWGKFIACSNYPACRHTEPWLDRIGIACPQCGGDLVSKRSRRGRPFFGCSNYPSCSFASWKQPLPTPCPSCRGLLVMHKKGLAQCIACGAQVTLDTA